MVFYGYVFFISNTLYFIEKGGIGMIQKTKIHLNDSIVQAEGNIVSDMDGEKVMLSIQNGKYYNLGVIGGQIWDLIQQPITLQGLIVKLQTDFDVTEEQCLNDVTSFLEHLHSEKLVVIESE